MEAQLFKIGKDSVGTRLDSYLASRLEEISRTRIRRAIEAGDVVVNQRVVRPSYRLRAADRIEVDLPEPPPLELLAEPLPVEVVYEDSDLVVVNKPAGMVVHPGAGVESGTLANALAYHFNELSGTAGRIRPGIIHRLDKETSGLLVVAKTDPAHERLSHQFRDRRVLKLYIALVFGHPSEPRGEIEAPIGRNPRNRTRMSVLSGGAGRPAHTLYKAIERFSGFTLLEVRIKTGRTHQIRVHLAHIGHPVVGDAVYGAGRDKTVREPGLKRSIAGLGRHFLHSARLGFRHPRTGQSMEFNSALPSELVDFISGLS